MGRVETECSRYGIKINWKNTHIRIISKNVIDNRQFSANHVALTIAKTYLSCTLKKD